MHEPVTHLWTMPLITSFILAFCSCGCTSRPPAQVEGLSQEKSPDTAASVPKASFETGGAGFLNAREEIPPEIPPPSNESQARARFTEATGLTCPRSAEVEAFGGHHWPPAFYVVLRTDSESLSEWVRNCPPWGGESWQCGPVTVELALAAGVKCMDEIQHTHYHADGIRLYRGTKKEIVEILNQNDLRFAGEYTQGKRGRLLVVDVNTRHAWLTVWEE